MTNAVISLPSTGQTRTHGRYKVVLSLPVDGGFSIDTYPATGVDRIDALSFTVADVDTANLIHRVIEEGGKARVHEDGVVAALDTALRAELLRVQARQDMPSRNRVEHINALLDRLESPADTAAVADQAATVRRNLADTVPAGRTPQVARSRTGVEHKPLSPAMQRALNAHLHNIVYPRDGVTRATLRALARRGLGTLHYAGSRALICSLELNKAGIAATVATAPAPAPTSRPTEIAVHNGSGTLVANTAAAHRYAPDITWQRVTAVEDDDTHIVATIDGEPVAIGKSNPVVVRAGGGRAVQVDAAELLNTAVA